MQFVNLVLSSVQYLQNAMLIKAKFHVKQKNNHFKVGDVNLISNIYLSFRIS